MSKMLTLLLCLFAANNTIEGLWYQQLNKDVPSRIKGRVFRSDTKEAISNSYILLENAREGHFDVRTNGKGEYVFGDIPPGNYTVSIFAWFPNKGDVPCQNPFKGKTSDDGKVTVEWQRKSQAFMEIVTIKEFSVDPGQQKIKDFDLFCN